MDAFVATRHRLAEGFVLPLDALPLRGDERPRGVHGLVQQAPELFPIRLVEEMGSSGVHCSDVGGRPVASADVAGRLSRCQTPHVLLVEPVVFLLSDRALTHAAVPAAVGVDVAEDDDI